MSFWENVRSGVRSVVANRLRSALTALGIIAGVATVSALVAVETGARLSGEQQQRVAIARALANDPETVTAGEPTGNLGLHAGAEVTGRLEALHAAGCTVIVVTYDEAVAARCDRRVRMQDGWIVEYARRGVLRP